MISSTFIILVSTFPNAPPPSTSGKLETLIIYDIIASQWQLWIASLQIWLTFRPAVSGPRQIPQATGKTSHCAERPGLQNVPAGSEVVRKYRS